MNFIDKQNIACIEIGGNGGKIARALDGRTARHTDVVAHFGGNDAGKRGFTKTGRTIEQNMIQRLTHGSGGLHVYAQAFLYFGLPKIFRKRFRPQGIFDIVFLGLKTGGNQALFIHNRYPPGLSSLD